MKLSERAFDLRDRMLLWVRSDSAAMKELADIADEIAALEAERDCWAERHAIVTESNNKMLIEIARLESRAGVTLSEEERHHVAEAIAAIVDRRGLTNEYKDRCIRTLHKLERTKAEGAARVSCDHNPAPLSDKSDRLLGTPDKQGAAPDAPLTQVQRAFYEAAVALAVLLDSHWTEERRPEWFNWQEDAIVRAYRAMKQAEGEADTEGR